MMTMTGIDNARGRTVWFCNSCCHYVSDFHSRALSASSLSGGLTHDTSPDSALALLDS